MRDENGTLNNDCAELHEKVDIMYEVLQTLQGHSEFLPKIYTALNEQTDVFINAAVGRKQVPIETMHFVVKILAGVITALVLILVFLCTGMKLGWFSLMGVQ